MFAIRKTTFLLLLCCWAGLQPADAQLSGRKVVIDPGHGGSDPGAVGIDGSADPNEADFNLDMALRFRTLLQNAGATVAMTRTTDATVSLTARRDFANAQSPNCFMSIHCNSFSTNTAHGTETFYSTGNYPIDGRWATNVQTRMLQFLGRHNRGVKQGSFTVLTASPPTCLAETLFISNQAEFNIMNSTAGKSNAAIAFYYAVGDFLGVNLASYNNAGAVSVTVPSTVIVGQSFTATVVMTNNGTKAWASGGATPHNLGSQNPQDNSRWGFNRVGLPSSPINPGQKATFNFTATAPATPGTYAFDWKMVQDAVEWFGATNRVNISVIIAPPAFTSQPQSQTKNQGETASFTVGASGSSLSYQWKKNGTNISGATASGYTRSNVQTGDAGNYSVLVSNSSGSTNSSIATLTVIMPPTEFLSQAITNNQVRLVVSAESGRNYDVQVSTNMVNWDPLTNFFNTNGVFEFFDGLTNEQRFYRVVKP